MRIWWFPKATAYQLAFLGGWVLPSSVSGKNPLGLAWCYLSASYFGVFVRPVTPKVLPWQTPGCFCVSSFLCKKDSGSLPLEERPGIPSDGTWFFGRVFFIYLSLVNGFGGVCTVTGWSSSKSFRRLYLSNFLELVFPLFSWFWGPRVEGIWAPILIISVVMSISWFPLEIKVFFYFAAVCVVSFFGFDYCWRCINGCICLLICFYLILT